MKRLLLLFPLLSLASPSFAEVSADLQFCGGLKSSAERLACYDAAARIAARPPIRPPVVADRAKRTELDALASLPRKAPILQLPLRSAFDGYYLAAGGGYGVGTGRDGVSRGNYTGTFGADLPIDTTDGASAHFVAGRNITFGLGFLGFELGGRYGGERGTAKAAGAGPFFGDAFSGSSQLTYRYRNDAGVHATVRAGAVFDDLMIFAKAGVGVSQITEMFTADERGISLFICPTRSPFNSCYLPGAQAPGINSVQATSWLPTMIFGVGVERNWGQFYARLGADFEAINHQETNRAEGTGVSGYSQSTDRIGQLTWTTRGTAMVGVRF